MSFIKEHWTKFSEEAKKEDEAIDLDQPPPEKRRKVEESPIFDSTGWEDILSLSPALSPEDEEGI
jgi:hypothetical protein